MLIKGYFAVNLITTKWRSVDAYYLLLSKYWGFNLLVCSDLIISKGMTQCWSVTFKIFNNIRIKENLVFLLESQSPFFRWHCFVHWLQKLKLYCNEHKFGLFKCKIYHSTLKKDVRNILKTIQVATIRLKVLKNEYRNLLFYVKGFFHRWWICLWCIWTKDHWNFLFFTLINIFTVFSYCI